MVNSANVTSQVHAKPVPNYTSRGTLSGACKLKSEMVKSQHYMYFERPALPWLHLDLAWPPPLFQTGSP